MLTGKLYPPPGTPPAGQIHDQQRNLGNLKTHTGNNTQAPEGHRGQTPVRRAAINSIRKATDKYANAMQGINATTESRETKDLNNSTTARSDQRENRQWPQAVNKLTSAPQSLGNNYYKKIATMTSRAHRSTTCSTTTYKTSGTEAQKTAAGSYKLHQRYPTSLTQQKFLNKLKGRIYTYPKKLGAKSDAYANRLDKGDVFAHLTSFKQTSESNIQTKHLSKRSPMLPLLLQSELSTVGNRRR
ncbi:hypothetical protein F511_18015 [Dorcoceras hygrometricum]|uniref:Uncharacterized protein n=1 Tax=Dorcoceras hygrometricum TaxID=472368 RepID=A0A2Z7ASL9_9LAMI|nr:hypothetical protein F511_18015 [Dorcoceras hygrometricum]